MKIAEPCALLEGAAVFLNMRGGYIYAEFFDKGRRKKALAMAVAAFTVMALAGCGKQQQAPQATLVKTMEVIKRDTPIVYDYTGFVQAQKEVNLMAQVSGQITGKYFLGGEK